MALSQGLGGPGNAASSNTEEMPSEMICGSRVGPNPGPARTRTLWSTSWDSARGSHNVRALSMLACGVAPKATVMCPVIGSVNPFAPACGMSLSRRP